ncbi:Hypothetical protein NTJ_00160 [Nesidiocoris tenuis]|uniref:DUF7041 domain-containing protein n=1 Tax=Nesidiocoris tenuis TaxID=355587 RepID=A0ABN7A596_9HEMI|nr:Hypothetical protein NTJ_00160 [Nesidiocoris tenuis]
MAISTDQEAAVAHIAIRFPRFYKPQPEMFFINIESQFERAKITSEQTKYFHLTSELEPEVLAEVSDILNNPATRTYTHLKAALLKRYGESDESRLNKLLSTSELGDRQPSQLLRDIRRLAGPTVPDDLVRGIWLRSLPPQVQQIIQSVSSASLDQQADVADKVMLVHSPSYLSPLIASTTAPVTATHPPTVEARDPMVASTSSSRTTHADQDVSSQLADLSRQVEVLTRSVATLMESHSATVPRERSNRFARSRTPPRDNRLWCYIHRKYGNNARSCADPQNCSYPADLSGNANPHSNQ